MHFVSANALHRYDKGGSWRRDPSTVSLPLVYAPFELAAFIFRHARETK